MSVNVVTSCSAKGWDSYGERFAVTFLANWSPNVKLWVVSEDASVLAKVRLFKWNTTYLEAVDLREASPEAKEFLARHANTPWVAGDASAPRPEGIGRKWRGDKGYWFRWDAYKFCRKIFATQAIARLVGTGQLLWLDADVVTFAKVPETLFGQVLPAQFPLSYLSRKEWGYHSECGFVGYNLDHPHANFFLSSFAGLYATDGVFKLDEWHDSWVFDWLREQLKIDAYAVPHKSHAHPFINSILGKYMDHCKGARKKLGRSQPQEQQGHKDVAYWKRP